MSITSIAISDIDNDGAEDIVFTDYISNEYSWFRNQDGLANFGNKLRISSYAYFVNHVDYGDIDGDGDLDLVSSSHADNKVALYKNNGDGTFAPQIIFSEPGFAYITNLQFADMDGDNDNDVLFASRTGDEVGYFLNEDGQGTFGEKIVTSEVPQNPSAIYGLDVDGDGDTDMIAHSSEGQKLAWFPNDGEANFGEGIEITSLIERVSRITSADINGDGKADLITSSYEDDKVAWFENLGTLFTNTISGVVRLDANADGCDAMDAAIPNLLIQSNNFNNSFATFTQADGSYTLLANEEPFTTAISSALPTYYTSNPASHTFDFSGLSETDSAADFCVEANQYLHYIIRFQNTGTASAINVRVNNRLDDKLNWSSLQLENLSHPGRVDITDGNNVNFIFDAINLPDSTSNEPASHGFIAYKIKPMDDVIVGDVFSNTAAIYFDFNPPIVTNTATTEIVLPVSVLELDQSSIKLYPNPAHTMLTLQAESLVDRVVIYDINGRLLRTLNPSSETVSLDVSDLIKGLYFMEVQMEGHVQTLRFVRQ